MSRTLTPLLIVLALAGPARAETVIAPLTDPKARLIFLQADLREARAERAALDSTEILRAMSLTRRIQSLREDIRQTQAEIAGN